MIARRTQWARGGKPADLGLLFVLALHAPAALGQALPVAGRGIASPAYVGQGQVPSQARDLLIVTGDRIQKAGQERFVLTGTYTDSKGSVAATVTWEAPGSLRFDRTGFPSLAYSGAGGVANSTALSVSDTETLETMLDDRPETFLYGFANGSTYRFLGARFRTDGGKTGNFAGPWYDIFETVLPVQAAGSKTPRQKFYCVDSETKLLALVTYTLDRGGTSATISTRYQNWTTKDGQAIPGKIVRSENGAVLFTFTVQSSSLGPAIVDAAFTKP